RGDDLSHLRPLSKRSWVLLSDQAGGLEVAREVTDRSSGCTTARGRNKAVGPRGERRDRGCDPIRPQEPGTRPERALGGSVRMSARTISFPKAVNEALHEEMARDADVIVLGEDIGRYGGMFRCTEGLFEKFGAKRVWDTPISESGFVGIGMGAAITGKRPV